MNQPKQNNPRSFRLSSGFKRITTAICVTIIVIFAVLWPVLILIASPENKEISTILGGFVFFIVLVVCLPVIWTLNSKSTTRRQIPHAHAAIVTHDRRRVLVSRGPGELHFERAEDRVYKIEDLRDRYMPQQLQCETTDGKKVTIAWTLVWNITDVERYLDSAKEPDAILDSTIRSLMMYHIGRHKREQLVACLEQLADTIAIQAYNRVRRYGIYVVAIHITRVESVAEPPKQPKAIDAEVERMRNLNSAVNETNPRTLLHIERLASFNRLREDEKKNERK